jgi:hypothetical protein
MFLKIVLHFLWKTTDMWLEGEHKENLWVPQED